jgi:hypothetical protein
LSYLFGFYKRNENGEELIDVLLKNKAGRSALTDAFQSKDVAVIELCLNHTSASEERLMDMSSVSQKPSEERTEAEKSAHAVEHHFLLSTKSHALTKVIKMRELPITKADHPFGSEEAPEDDSTGASSHLAPIHAPGSILCILSPTGLCIWPAAIILARWITDLFPPETQALREKTVVELGAGCGLPAITAGEIDEIAL